MHKEELKPVDLTCLEDKIVAVCDAFEKYEDVDRTGGYREYHLREARKIAESLRRDFRRLFDEYRIGGLTPYGLSEYQNGE